MPVHAVQTGRDVLSSKTHRRECLQGSKVAVLLCSTILDLGSIASFHRPLQALCTPAHVFSVTCQDCMKAGQYSASSASEHLNVNVGTVVTTVPECSASFVTWHPRRCNSECQQHTNIAGTLASLVLIDVCLSYCIVCHINDVGGALCPRNTYIEHACL